MGRTSYASSFTQTLVHATDAGWDGALGVQLGRSLTNRGAKATHERAVLNQAQLHEAIANVALLVAYDVRRAYLDTERTERLIAATTASRRLQEEKLRTEQARFDVGKSTSLAVAQVQRDLLTAQLAEAQAHIAYRQALVDLYRNDGSYLARHGIQAPGAPTPQGH